MVQRAEGHHGCLPQRTMHKRGEPCCRAGGGLEAKNGYVVMEPLSAEADIDNEDTSVLMPWLDAAMEPLSAEAGIDTEDTSVIMPWLVTRRA